MRVPLNASLNVLYYSQNSRKGKNKVRNEFHNSNKEESQSLNEASSDVNVNSTQRDEKNYIQLPPGSSLLSIQQSLAQHSRNAVRSSEENCSEEKRQPAYRKNADTKEASFHIDELNVLDGRLKRKHDASDFNLNRKFSRRKWRSPQIKEGAAYFNENNSKSGHGLYRDGRGMNSGVDSIEPCEVPNEFLEDLPAILPQTLREIREKIVLPFLLNCKLEKTRLNQEDCVTNDDISDHYNNKKGISISCSRGAIIYGSSGVGKNRLAEAIVGSLHRHIKFEANNLHTGSNINAGPPQQEEVSMEAEKSEDVSDNSVSPKIDDCQNILNSYDIAKGLSFYQLSAASLSAVLGSTGEDLLERVFDAAKTNHPAILVLDHLDAIEKKTGGNSVGAQSDENLPVALPVDESPIIKALSHSMDTLHNYSVFVIGLASSIDAVPRSLRRSGRFSEGICLKPPVEWQREALIMSISSGFPLLPDVDVRQLVAKTNGFVAADIHALFHKAVICAAAEGGLMCLGAGNEEFRNEEYEASQNVNGFDKKNTFCEIDKWKGQRSVDCCTNKPLLRDDEIRPINYLQGDLRYFKLFFSHGNVTGLSAHHFRKAILDISASVEKRKGCMEFEKAGSIEWADVGGIRDVKRLIEEKILFPILMPRFYEQLGVTKPAGILLYGPPGCGKTFLARAMAKSCGASFFPVKGPELLSKYVGESEASLRRLFAKASASAPAVIFFDEIDALCGSRGGGLNAQQELNEDDYLYNRCRQAGNQNIGDKMGELNGKNSDDEDVLKSGRRKEQNAVRLEDRGLRERAHGKNARSGFSTSGGGYSGSSSRVDERLIAQMLTELDGVAERGKVFVVGATNRPDAIDSAILRPGRLEIQAHVRLPDLKEREEILLVNIGRLVRDAMKQKKKFEELEDKEQLYNADFCRWDSTSNHSDEKIIESVVSEIDFEQIAEKCQGFSGADLESLLREAVYIMVQEQRDKVVRTLREKLIEHRCNGVNDSSYSSLKNSTGDFHNNNDCGESKGIENHKSSLNHVNMNKLTESEHSISALRSINETDIESISIVDKLSSFEVLKKCLEQRGPLQDAVLWLQGSGQRKFSLFSDELGLGNFYLKQRHILEALKKARPSVTDVQVEFYCAYERLRAKTSC